METNYGRIGIIYNVTTDNGEFGGGIYKCNTRGKEMPAEVGIEAHLARARRDTIQAYGLICPYCVATFKNLATLNRHSRNKICKFTK